MIVTDEDGKTLATISILDVLAALGMETGRRRRLPGIDPTRTSSAAFFVSV
jgi:hypothetical protein